MSTRPAEDTAPAWASHMVPVFRGLFDTRIDDGADYDTKPLGLIFNMKPWDKPKASGPAFVPSLYIDYDAREHSAQREKGSFVALTGDIDSGDHPRDAVTEAVRAFVGDAAWVVYSSPHARPGDMRWRILIPIDVPIPFETWFDAQSAFFAFMEARGFAMDRALARAGQPVFLPNVPSEHAKSHTPLRGEDGKPLYFTRVSSPASLPGLPIDIGPVAEGIAALRMKRIEDEALRDRIRKEAEARRAASPRGDGASLMEDFNAANSVATMLELCGYEQSPRNAEDWHSPHQTGDTFATRIIGSKWVSLSQSDASAGVGTTCKSGCFGDAYDLYVHYKHNGDHKAAYRALGQEKRDANVIRFPQPEPPEWMAETPMPDEPPEWMEMDSGDVDHGADMPGMDEAESALLPLIDVSKWIGHTPPDRLFAWGDNIPLHTTTMLTGPGGVGKSLLEQMLCTCIALGLPFLGVETRQMNTLYVTCEDDADELWRRQTSICSALKVPLKAIIGKLHLVSLCGENETALATFDDKEQLERTARWRQLEQTCAECNIQLYAFDNATDAMAGDLNSIHQVAEFVNLLTGLAIRLGGAAMILHHPNKAGDDWLGSVAWHNKVRSRLIIKHSEVEGDDDGRVLENPKANYGPSGGKISFRWHKGAFVADRDLPPDVAAEMHESIRASAFNKKFLECLAKVTTEKRNVSHSKAASNYAPRIFAGMTIGRGYDEKGLGQAMERLLHLGKIEASERAFQYPNRSWAIGLRPVPEEGKEL